VRTPRGAAQTDPTYYFRDCQSGAAADCVPGSNSNAGTRATEPKRDLTGFDLNRLAAGTRLLFARGGSWSDVNLRVVNLNATPSRPIVFDAYGSGPIPVFQATRGIAIEFGDYNEFNQDGGYTLRNLKLDGRGSAEQGLWLRNDLRSVTLENLEITGFKIGIHSQPGEPHGINGLVVRGSFIHGNREHGMLGGANDMVLEGNTVAGNNPDGGAFEHGFYLSVGRDVVVRNNIFANNSAPGGICNGGNLTLHGKLENWLIEGNTITQQAAVGGCYGLSITPGYHSAEWFRRFTVRGNKIVNVGGCAICIGAAPGIVVEDNIIVNLQDTPQIGIQIPTGKPSPGDEADGAAIVRNNTVFMARAGQRSVGVSVVGGSRLQVVSNLVYFGAESNTVTACFAHDAAASYVAFDHNLCHHVRGKGSWSAMHATLAAARKAGFDRGGKSDDPRFADAPSPANQWHCRVGIRSPAVAAGHPVLSSPLARTTQNAPDIGGCGRAPA
jgi:hypothetical protein